MWTKRPQNVDLLTLKVQESSLWLGFHACKCAMKWENILSNFENCVKCSKSGLYYCSWSPTWVFPAYIIVLNQLRIHSWQKVLATTILWGLSLPILDLTQMTWCLLVLWTWVGICAKSEFRLCWMTLRPVVINHYNTCLCFSKITHLLKTHICCFGSTSLCPSCDTQEILI